MPCQISETVAINSISALRKAAYSYDWYRIFSRTDTRQCRFAFGDVQYVADQPTFTKSRPITTNNHNNVILPLETHRHFDFMQDALTFHGKEDCAIWRGAAYQEHRKRFLEKTQSVAACDARDTSRYAEKNWSGSPVDYLNRKSQLKNKFICAIEGNDVASNLKWIMASNSVPIMPKPKFETWFLESTLIANQHYIEIAQEFDDLEEVLEKFLSMPRLAEEINQESKAYAAQFFDQQRQYAIARLVAEMYFDLVRS